MQLVKAKPREILVIWHDALGREQIEPRKVHFERGFGHYVKWNRHMILVDPLQTELRVDMPGPRAVVRAQRGFLP